MVKVLDWVLPFTGEEIAGTFIPEGEQTENDPTGEEVTLPVVLV